MLDGQAHRTDELVCVCAPRFHTAIVVARCPGLRHPAPDFLHLLHLVLLPEACVDWLGFPTGHTSLQVLGHPALLQQMKEDFSCPVERADVVFKCLIRHSNVGHMLASQSDGSTLGHPKESHYLD